MMVTPPGNGSVSIFYDVHGTMNVCVKNNRNVGSSGVWLGDNPLHFVLPVTLCQMIVISTTCRVLCSILKPLRTPKFICNVLGGILLGPSFLGRNKIYWNILFPARQAEFLVLASVIGAVYFIFMIAVKMDVVTTLRAAKSTWRLGVTPLLASFVVIMGLLHLYNPQELPRFRLQANQGLLSAIMSFSSFPVISEALMELNLITTELGQIALSCGMLNEAVEWFMIAVQLVLRQNEAKYAILSLSYYWLLIFFCIFIIRPTLNMIVQRTPVGKPVREVYIVLIFLGVLVMAAISDMIGSTFVIGPLLCGLATPNGPPLGTTLIERSELVISEILLPFFFIFVGMNTNLFAITNWRVLIIVQCIMIAGYLAKVLACVLVSLAYNIRPKHGIVLGLILNIKGINELIGLARLRKLKMLDDQTFSYLALSLVVTSAIISPVVKILYKHHPRVLSSATGIHQGRIRTIQNTPRHSEFRIVSCLHNEGNVRSIIALLEACNPILESPICVYVIHLIELLGKSTPILLPMNKQNRKSLCVNYPAVNYIMRAFENYASNSSGPVTVLPYVNVAPYKLMHEAICNLAEDKLVPFLIIPFHENDQTLGGHASTSIRDLNTTFQARALCTVGILVDRHSRLSMSSSKFGFHVGIFFIGGPDDREALALGIRMSERAHMSVSLFRFSLMNKNLGGSEKEATSREEEEEEEVESMLDESLVDEFKAKKFGSGNVSWHEILVEDEAEILGAIRGLEGNYDLVMVGRRHNIGSFSDEEMSNFIENAEILGVFGDMLASPEFCSGVVPVLVTQCAGKRVKRVNRLDRVASVPLSQKILGSN